jgi:hypothetical protein
MLHHGFRPSYDQGGTENTWQKGGSSGTAPNWATASACVGGLDDPYIFHTLGTTPISTPTRQKHP